MSCSFFEQLINKCIPSTHSGRISKVEYYNALKNQQKKKEHYYLFPLIKASKRVESCNIVHDKGRKQDYSNWVGLRFIIQKSCNSSLLYLLSQIPHTWASIRHKISCCYIYPKFYWIKLVRPSNCQNYPSGPNNIRR